VGLPQRTRGPYLLGINLFSFSTNSPFRERPIRNGDADMLQTSAGTFNALFCLVADHHGHGSETFESLPLAPC